MANFSTNFNSNSFGNSKGVKVDIPTKSFGRVLDIILDENHPEYENKGGAKSINGVFFRYQNSITSEDTSNNLKFAYQGTGQIKTVPVIGEIVEIVSNPTSNKTQLAQAKTLYYSKIVNIWNNPNSNTLLDVYSNQTLDISKGGEFTEQATINPIKSAVGDIQIEGRQGQSIRFTGSKGSANYFVDDTNKGKPVIIISNGQIQTEDGFTTISEDINEDDSSLYFLSDHKIDIKQASVRRKSYDDAPIEGDRFKGNQIIINSGRLLFNAKTNDILLSSKDSIGMNSKESINLDADKYICFDSPKILLGEKARTAPDSNKEPVLLGNQTELLLDTLLKMLKDVANDMAAAKTVDGKPIPNLNKRGIQMLPTINALQRQINPTGPSKLKSKKVFTE